MSGEETLRVLATELRALVIEGVPKPASLTAAQLADAVDRAAERVGYRDWEERMGDDL